MTAYDADDFDPDIAAAQAAASGGDCGPCREATAAPPQHPDPHSNAPGLGSLAYRVGTHREFVSAMLDRLSAFPQQFGRLSTRAADDFTVALLDAAAVPFDVVAFYQERIANEHYLRTAIESRSVEALAALLGHVPNPGVAATTRLAFDVDVGKTPQIPTYTAARSVPVLPNEQPQVFETTEAIDAHWRLNRLGLQKARVGRRIVPPFTPGTRLTLAGTGLTLRPNDLLLFGVTPDGLARVKVVTEDVDAGRTTVRLGERGEDTRPDPKVHPNGMKDTLKQVAGQCKDVAKSLRAVTKPPSAEQVAAQLAAALESAGNVFAREGDAETPKTKEVADAAKNAATDLDKAGDRNVLTAALRKKVEQLSVEIDVLHEAANTAGYLLFYRTHHLKEALDGVRPALPAPNGAALLDLFDVDFVRGRLAPALAAAVTRNDILTTLTREVAEFSMRVADRFTKTDGTIEPDVQKWMRDKFAPAMGKQVGRLALLDRNTLDLWDTIERYLGEQAGVPADTQIAAKIRHTLAAIQNALLTTERGGIAALAFGLLSELQADGLRASVAEYPRVRPWVDAIVADVTDRIGRLPSAARPQADQSAQADEDAKKRLENLFGQLKEAGTTTSEALVPAGDLKELPLTPAQLASLTDPVAAAAVEQLSVNPSDQPTHIKVFRDRAQPFGATAQRPVKFAAGNSSEDKWPTVDVDKYDRLLPLDRVYEGVVEGSLVVVERIGAPKTVSEGPAGAKVFRVVKVETKSRVEFGLASEVTELTLNDNWLEKNEKDVTAFQRITVHVRSEAIPFAPEPYDADLAGQVIELDGIYPNLTPDRRLIVRGQRTDLPDNQEVAAEEVLVSSSAPVYDAARPGDRPHTRVILKKSLRFSYKRATAEVFGNVAGATHGETVKDEVLGTPMAFPADTVAEAPLAQKPLTFVRGLSTVTRPELTVRVDGVEWEPVNQLAGRPSDAHVYAVSVAADGAATVRFGDGREGGRPSGTITATYRHGLGRAGNVAAGAISQLVSQHLGVSAVTNPLPANDGADREGPDVTRTKAPLTVASIGRVVAVPDYTAFARKYPGIAKAAAAKFPPAADAARVRVGVTVAGIDAAEVPKDVLTALGKALTANGDPGVVVEVLSCEPRRVEFTARIRVDPAYVPEGVKAEVETKLLAAFGVAHRDLGRPMWRSELVATAQRVRGVVGVEVTKFRIAGDDAAPKAVDIVQALPMRHIPDKGKISPAQLVFLTSVRWEEK